MGHLDILVCFYHPICSVADLEATNSEPYLVVSTVSCLLENQSVGVVLTKLTQFTSKPWFSGY